MLRRYSRRHPPLLPPLLLLMLLLSASFLLRGVLLPRLLPVSLPGYSISFAAAAPKYRPLDSGRLFRAAAAYPGR